MGISTFEIGKMYRFLRVGREGGLKVGEGG
jgi:hypothetical protein